MHAVLRSIDSAALLPETLATHQPPVADDFGVLLDLAIGPSDGDAAEDFYVTVCTRGWLARVTLTEPGKRFEFVRHRLVVDRWDPDLFERAIEDLCLHTSGPDWHAVATKLSTFLAWEFEDYIA